MKLIGIGGFLLITTTSSFGASFDCQKATTKVERLICSNTKLSKLDSKMSDDFFAVIAPGQMPDQDREPNIQEQKTWLKQRNQCQTTVCLFKSYKKRLATLDILLNTYD